jgi:hypothetical protein
MVSSDEFEMLDILLMELFKNECYVQPPYAYEEEKNYALIISLKTYNPIIYRNFIIHWIQYPLLPKGLKVRKIKGVE